MITPEFDEGSLFLRDDKGALVRLAWESRGDASREANRGRKLPAGKYTLLGYRLVDRSRAGEVWHVSGTGTKRKPIEIPAHGQIALGVPHEISVKQRFDGESAGMEIRGAHAAGLSIYKNGARIPIGYRVLDAGGAELTQGSMNYG